MSLQIALSGSIILDNFVSLGPLFVLPYLVFKRFCLVRVFPLPVIFILLGFAREKLVQISLLWLVNFIYFLVLIIIVRLSLRLSWLYSGVIFRVLIDSKVRVLKDIFKSRVF